MELSDERTVMEMGGSLVISVPKTFADNMRLKKGDKVKVTMTDENQFRVEK